MTTAKTQGFKSLINLIPQSDGSFEYIEFLFTFYVLYTHIVNTYHFENAVTWLLVRDLGGVIFRGFF